MDSNIEVFDEDFISVVPNNQINTENNKDDKKEEDVINLDRLFSNDSEEVIDAYEEDKLKEELKQKKITKLQIILIVILLVVATLTYFFGYDFFEPYIKID